MRQQSRVAKRFQDFIPEQIGRGFVNELTAILAANSTESFRNHYLAEELLSKFRDENVVSADQRRDAAIAKWLATEQRNSVTNQRLLLAEESMVICGATWGKYLRIIRNVVAEVLGPLHYPLILWDGAHSSGASTRVKRSPTALIDKLTGEAHVTETARAHWELATVGTVLEDQKLETVQYSVLFTVPKSTDIDRVAAKEPECNMLMQRSVGNHIRRRLRRKGINLNDQTRNQRLAERAYRDKLATVDLSSASDSISNQLVTLLLPFDWWSLLDDIRVHGTTWNFPGVEREVHPFEMFSSMGNGFTFELESLIFYAICVAVRKVSGVRGVISVYGDDIICPSAIARRLGRLLAFLGFKMNPKKTNITGPFRESCGRHYYRGRDVTPFYIREPIAKVGDLIRSLNQLLKWDSQGYGFFHTQNLAEFHHKWSRVVPQALWGGQMIEGIDSLVTGHSPRKRILFRSQGMECDETARYYTWLTLRRLTTDVVSVTPKKEGRPFLGPQPSWLVRTGFTPYLLYGGR